MAAIGRGNFGASILLSSAAPAELGRYEEAVRAQTEALRVANLPDNADNVFIDRADAEARLEVYQTRQAYRDTVRR